MFRVVVPTKRPAATQETAPIPVTVIVGVDRGERTATAETITDPGPPHVRNSLCLNANSADF